MPVFDDSRKHPLIFESDSRIIYMITKQAHDDLLHPGHFGRSPEKILDYRTQNLGKKIEMKCVTCLRWRGIKMEQRMSNLPSFRLSSNYPFEIQR